jgi:hypothetical protein
MTLGSTQPLTEMSTRYLPGVKGLPERKADNLTPSLSRLSTLNLIQVRKLRKWLEMESLKSVSLSSVSENQYCDKQELKYTR